MAYIEKRKNRKGEFAGYRIRAYSGYDVNGKQMVQYKSWTPPKDMSPRQAEKEVQRLAVLFDEECSHGQVTAAVKLFVSNGSVSTLNSITATLHYRENI